MSNPVIRVEHLGKKYIISHQQQQRRYVALRDVLNDRAKSVARNLIERSSRKIPDPAHEEFWALKDVSFEIERGDCVGIVGRNGAGKSTLLKILSRITEPSTGRIYIKGRVASLLEVGTGFHPELTGRENIYLNGAILGMSKLEIKKKFDRIVAFAEVEKFLDTPVKRYSSGMYVRLAFAVAAHLETEILVIDEVLAVGDSQFQKKCLGKMEDVAKNEGRTVLFVSHNMAAVNNLCKQSILLNKGGVVQIGKTSLVTDAYLSIENINEDNGKVLRGYRLDSSQIQNLKSPDIEIVNIEVLNPKKLDIGPRTGDPMLIRVSYNANSDFLSPAFLVMIKDIYGQEIIRLSTMPISGYTIQSLHSNGCLDLLIESLPLVAGRYYFDLGFSRENTMWKVKLDRVVEFDVQFQDCYGSGVMLDRSRGLLVIKHKWEHRINEKVG